ncbi:MAG TPA: hypothetical protein VIP05_01110 [Burkholderiaceae bacterium]
MTPLANRHNAAADAGRPPADAPMQVLPWTEDSPRTIGAEDADARYQGELFLPGWLKIELNPTAEQGPGA